VAIGVSILISLSTTPMMCDAIPPPRRTGEQNSFVRFSGKRLHIACYDYMFPSLGFFRHQVSFCGHFRHGC